MTETTPPDHAPPKEGLGRRLRRGLHPEAAWRRLRRLARRELPFLVVPMLLLGAVWGFAEVADEVVEGETQAFDEWVLQALREPAGGGSPLGPEWLANAARDVTALGSMAVLGLITVIVLGYLAMRRLWGASLLILVAVVGGAGVSQLLKNTFERKRPSIVPHLDEVITYSFPSGHSLMSAVTYLTLGALLARLVAQRRLKSYFFAVAGLLTLLVGSSRVFVGVHYPTDVVAGWLAGLGWAALCWLVAGYLQSRGHVEEEVGEGDSDADEEVAEQERTAEEPAALSGRS